ncbi:restriction endonuclease subunit S [Pseudoalteromonas sp. C12FD-1]|uniref:restriction endonuclease subunit S n=1 Tax=Pseudoalteromonas sp. C12FD-1 TaxID=3131979 RepID=UPI00307DA56B
MSWPLVDFQDVVFFQEGPGVRKWQFRSEGIKLINVKNIVNENLCIKNSDKYLDETEVNDKYSHFLCDEGDLVMASSGATWGKTAWVSKADLPLCMNTSMIRFKSLDSKKLCKYYLRRYLQTDLFKNQMNRLITGSAQPNFGPSHLKQIKIPLPPLDEQKRIAAILDKADSVRRKRQQTINLADDFLRSVFLDMFGDPAINPKGWEVKSLGEMIVKGPTNGLYKPASDYGSGARILRIDGFYDGVLSDQSKLKRVKITDAEMEKFGLSERSIVINRVNSKEYLGKCGFAQHIEESTVFESNMMNFKVDETKLNPRFLVQQLQMPNIKMQIATCSKDAVNQSSINQNDVKSFEIIVPTIELQNEYENVCKRFLASKLNYDDSSNLNSELFNSLSQKAFAGEL